MINDRMTQCRYCSVPVDEGISALLAERQTKANQAYSDAIYLKVAASAMFVFLAVGLFLTVGWFGFVGTVVVVVVLLIRWQLRFGDLFTNDPDYQRARRSKNLALILLIVALPLGFILSPFLDAILSTLGLV
jgi:hypothetical protein